MSALRTLYASSGRLRKRRQLPLKSCESAASGTVGTVGSGIGGAAIFTPIFMIIFPLLGPEYPLPSIAASIGVALLTATFGSSSGFLGYFRKRLVDFKSAVPCILVGAPVGVFGAVLLTSIKEYEEALRGAYALLMFVLVYVLIRRHSPAEGAPADVVPTPQIREIILVTARRIPMLFRDTVSGRSRRVLAVS